jgi:hypothetical protein
VEHTLPVQTAAMGTKEAVFFRGAERLGLPLNTAKDVTRDSFRPQENAILQPGGTAGRATDAPPSHLAPGHGLHALGAKRSPAPSPGASAPRAKR